MLRMLTFNVEGSHFSDQSLEKWQIQVAKRVSRLNEIVGNATALEKIDVAVVAFDCITQADQEPLIMALHSQAVCVIGVNDDCLPLGPLLDAGADAVVSKRADASQIACAIWSAHRRFLTHRKLKERLSHVTENIERRQRTDRGKAGLAEMLNISESDALGRIRRISRNARRPMSEICETLIAAQQIIESAKRLIPSPPKKNNPRGEALARDTEF